VPENTGSKPLLGAAMLLLLLLLPSLFITTGAWWHHVCLQFRTAKFAL
jgi:hypothetical protein